MREIKHGAKWAYILQDFDPAKRNDADVIVVDLDTPITARQMQKLKRRHIVLAYVSVGEAESFRDYFEKRWNNPAARPAFILGENREWPGCFTVRYWHTAWQQLISERVREAQDAGFDGMYLDKVDAYEDVQFNFPQVAKGRTNFLADMADFVCQLSDDAKKRDHTFKVVLQNGEKLLALPAVTRRIDAFAKEDLYYGDPNDEQPNYYVSVKQKTALMKDHWQRAVQKPVVVFEYIENKRQIADAAHQARESGFSLTILNPNRELRPVC